jgi:hypothetical protein
MGRLYIRISGETPVPVGANIDSARDFEMTKVQGTWTFRQHLPAR